MGRIARYPWYAALLLLAAFPLQSHASRLVMSGDTFLGILEHDNFTTPDGQSFNAREEFWRTRLLVVAPTDSVVLDLDTRDYRVYTNTSPSLLITGHTDFNDIHPANDVAVYSRASRLFHVDVGASEFDAPEAMTFVGQFLYGAFIDAGARLDVDHDGLVNRDEVAQGTLLNNPDSDGDGLSDGDEVWVYGTSPTMADTDGDGFDDNDEINVYGSDPLVATDTPANGDVTEDGQINAADLVVCTRIALGMTTVPTPQQTVRCDMAPVDAQGIPRPDGQVNAADLLLLVQAVK